MKMTHILTQLSTERRAARLPFVLRKRAVAVLLSLILPHAGADSAFGNHQDELAKLRGVVAPLHQVEAARAAGWDLVPGLDYCFSSDQGGMGFHFINVGLLDTIVDALQPEALVFHILPNGRLQLGAVEYIVPKEAWDAEGHGDLPMLFGQHFHLNAALGVYVLHAWIYTHNPLGIFNDWNPLVTCPAE
jgi:hypothetical protein